MSKKKEYTLNAFAILGFFLFIIFLYFLKTYREIKTIFRLFEPIENVLHKTISPNKKYIAVYATRILNKFHLSPKYLIYIKPHKCKSDKLKYELYSSPDAMKNKIFWKNNNTLVIHRPVNSRVYYFSPTNHILMKWGNILDSKNHATIYAELWEQ